MINFLKTSIEQIRALRRHIFLFNKLESIVNDNNNFNLFDKAKKYLDDLITNTAKELDDQLVKIKEDLNNNLLNYYTEIECDDRYLLKEEAENYLKFTNPSMNNIIEINAGEEPALEFKSRSNPYIRIKDIDISGSPFKIIKNGTPIFELNNLGIKQKKKTIINEENISSFITMTDWKFLTINNAFSFELPSEPFHEFWMPQKNQGNLNAFYIYIKNTLSLENNSQILDEDITKNGSFPLLGSPFYTIIDHVNQPRWATVAINHEKSWNKVESKRKIVDPDTYVLKPGENYGIEKRKKRGSKVFYDYIRKDWVDYEDIIERHPAKIKFEVYWLYAQRKKHHHHGSVNLQWKYDGGSYDVYWR